MIKIDDKDFKLEKTYSPHFRKVTLFDSMSIDLWKKGKGDFLHWSHPGAQYSKSPYGLHIQHHGKLTYHAIKRTIERYLSYQDSALQKALLKQILK